MSDRSAAPSSPISVLRAKAFPLLGRLYIDLVKRRSRVEVVPAVDGDGDGVEVAFIIGCFRSGTTLLRYVLDSHSRIGSPPETEFLAGLTGLMSDERTSDALEDLGFDAPHVRQQLRRQADYFYSNYARAKGVDLVVDKTPSYVLIVDQISNLYPDARCIGLYRHPLDQINSFTRGLTYALPEISSQFGDPNDHRPIAIAERAAHYWQASTDAMASVAASDRSRWLEIRYEDFCDAAEASANRCLEHLGMAWEDGITEYWNYSHDVGMEGGKALGERTIALKQGDWKSWDPAIVDRCLEITAPGRRRLGYGDDAVSRSPYGDEQFSS